MTRVLVVDDEAPIRRAMRANLEARGYTVDPAIDGERALELATAAPPDLVILDLGLPGLDGVEVIHRLRGWFSGPMANLARPAPRSRRHSLRRRYGLTGGIAPPPPPAPSGETHE